MNSFSGTIDFLARFSGSSATDRAATAADRPTEIHEFGDNPGNLRAYEYVPDSLPDAPALVVVLHGCRQTASDYDHGAGWSDMADRHGFVLLFPEQRQQNNAYRCFNWFSPNDIRRDEGECLSIRQMIAAMAERHHIDPSRIYLTGLSAGGAMVSVMLATYPELFAGGAVIAGLPYGTANSVLQAINRMRGQGLPDDQALTAMVQNASGHTGKWPRLSIWQGSADETVDAANAEAIHAQWRGVQGLGATPSRTEHGPGFERRVWTDPSGNDLIDVYEIAGMGHGTPLDTQGADGCGAPGPFMLEAGISSTEELCRQWRIGGPRLPPAKPGAPAASPTRAAPRGAPDARHRAARGTMEAFGQILRDALRGCGLSR